MRGVSISTALPRLHVEQAAALPVTALRSLHSSSRVLAKTQTPKPQPSILSSVASAITSALPSLGSASSSKPAPRPKRKHGPDDISRMPRADLVRFITLSADLPGHVTAEQRRAGMIARGTAARSMRKKMPVYVARRTWTADEAEDMDQVLRACRRLGLALNRTTADEIMHLVLKTGRPDLMLKFFKNKTTYGLPYALSYPSMVHLHQSILNILNKPSAYVHIDQLELPPLPILPPFTFKISPELALFRLLIHRKLQPPAARPAKATGEDGSAPRTRKPAPTPEPSKLLEELRDRILGQVQTNAARYPGDEGQLQYLLGELRGLGKEWEAVGRLLVKEISPDFPLDGLIKTAKKPVQ